VGNPSELKQREYISLLRSNEPIRKKLFGTVDRTYNFFSILTSVISVALGFYFYNLPTVPPWYVVVRDVSIVFLLVGMILFFAYKYVRKDDAVAELNVELNSLEIEHGREIELVREKNKILNSIISSQIDHKHQIAQFVTEELFDGYNNTFLKTKDIPIYEEEFFVFKKICALLTTRVRQSFKEFFISKDIDIREDISVSVKLILSPGILADLYPNNFPNKSDKLKDLEVQSPCVVTVFRDSYTYVSQSRSIGGREVLKTLYRIDDNTAFQDIFWAQHDRFCSDDLTNLYLNKGYKNENPNWQKYYNSTLVVPLVLEHLAKNKRRCLGFLAVDSLNQQKHSLYERNESYSILKHASLMLSNYFIAQTLYHDNGN
jgi:hypothetical protein